MEKQGGNYTEGNQYESFGKLQKTIEDKILDCNSTDSKLIRINTLLDILENFESYLCSDNDANISYIQRNLGIEFENLVNNLSDDYINFLINKLKAIAFSLENPQGNKSVKLKVEEVVCSTIEKALNNANLKFSTKLNQSQVEYLSRNEDECKKFISILEVIGKIKTLPSVSDKALSIAHLTAPINHIKANFRGRMTATKNENTKKYIDLSNCVEVNLSSSDRFIFSLENTVDKDGNDQTLINVKVLGKPPYKH